MPWGALQAFLGCKVSHPPRCGEIVVFDGDGGHCDEGCHGQSGCVDGDGGAHGFHQYSCLCHRALYTYNTRT